MICNLGVVGSNPSIGSSSGKGLSGEILGEYQSGQMGQTVNLLTYVFGGSNPSSPTIAEVAQLVEHQPSKLRVASSNLVFRSNFFNCCRCSSGVERILGKDEVMSSIPITGSIFVYSQQ